MAAIHSSLAALLLLAACGAPAAENAPEPVRAVRAAACEQRTFEGSRFTLCRYDRRRDQIALFLDGPDHRALRSFDALERVLGARAGRLRFAMNAGMFDDAGWPIGLYVDERSEVHPINHNRGPGNFHMLPNGIFQVSEDGFVAVRKSDDYLPQFPPLFATQSGPMLVIDGRLHPGIQDNGPSLHVRNGVGVDSRDTAWFVISDDAVSFGRLARFFRDVLHCPNALYLDGSVSSLWDRPAGRRDTNSELGPLIAVFQLQGRQ